MMKEWDYIRSMHATFIDGTTYQGIQAWLMLKAFGKPPSGAPQLTQFPFAKKTYKAKNPAGGIKCHFGQSRAYKKKGDRWDTKLASGIIKKAAPWYGWEE